MANFALRLDDELKQKLTEIAKEEKRSLNKMIEHILESHVKQSGPFVNTPTWFDEFNKTQIDNFIKSSSEDL